MIYIPPSIKTAKKHLGFALAHNLRALSKAEFLKAWHSISYLYPGLHPDGYQCKDSGWPKRLKPIAREAWRRSGAAELTDNELYCYQAAKARILRAKARILRARTGLWRIDEVRP